MTANEVPAPPQDEGTELQSPPTENLTEEIRVDPVDAVDVLDENSCPEDASDSSNEL